MNRKVTALGLVLALIFNMSGALAQDDDDPDDMEATMRVMGKAEAELPDAITNEIALPPPHTESLPEAVDPESPAVEASADGLTKAHDNWPFADDALNNAADIVEQAQENRENRGRSEDRPEPPEPPDPPGPPGGPPGG